MLVSMSIVIVEFFVFEVLLIDCEVVCWVYDFDCVYVFYLWLV